jgi:FKBP-type peptidyl-prolyl cis-trans isomerase
MQPTSSFVVLATATCLLCACDLGPGREVEGSPPEGQPAQAAAEPAAATVAAQAPAPPAPSAIPAPADVAAPPTDAQKTASGLAFKVLEKGTGTAKPSINDRVSVHYTGWTTDGRMFDSSVQRGSPATFGVSGVIRGWTEGLQLMVQGEKRRFWIPASLAYGESPRAGAPAGMLVFDVELLELHAAPKAPEDVAAPPKSAKKTPSGLAYRVLQPGRGTRKPTATSSVMVHYSGWTRTGELFDSSVSRGTPASFRLDQVIKGWTEGVQLMVEGEKARFWIPGDLAYGEKPARPGAPAGMLVFDIELLQIRD